jgi:hypothetical protein
MVEVLPEQVGRERAGKYSTDGIAGSSPTLR